MNAKNITITSKNQITLPIDYVRNMQLAQNRVLQIELRGKSLILTPQPSLIQAMRKFWKKHHAKKPLTDQEIKQGIRASSAGQVAKTL